IPRCRLDKRIVPDGGLQKRHLLIDGTIEQRPDRIGNAELHAHHREGGVRYRRLRRQIRLHAPVRQKRRARNESDRSPNLGALLLSLSSLLLAWRRSRISAEEAPEQT